MKPFEVIGPWHPSLAELEVHWGWKGPLTMPSSSDWTLRTPDWHPGDVVEDWHQDGPEDGIGLLLWSNEYPTEVLLPNGKIIRPEPYDFVLIDNKVVEHRVPMDLQAALRTGRPTNRYFVRTFRIEHSFDRIGHREIKGWRQQLAALERRAA